MRRRDLDDALIAPSGLMRSSSMTVPLIPCRRAADGYSRRLLDPLPDLPVVRTVFGSGPTAGRARKGPSRHRSRSARRCPLSAPVAPRCAPSDAGARSLARRSELGRRRRYGGPASRDPVVLRAGFDRRLGTADSGFTGTTSRSGGAVGSGIDGAGAATTGGAGSTGARAPAGEAAGADGALAAAPRARTGAPSSRARSSGPGVRAGLQLGQIDDERARDPLVGGEEEQNRERRDVDGQRREQRQERRALGHGCSSIQRRMPAPSAGGRRGRPPSRDR